MVLVIWHSEIVYIFFLSRASDFNNLNWKINNYKTGEAFQHLSVLVKAKRQSEDNDMYSRGDSPWKRLFVQYEPP